MRKEKDKEKDRSNLVYYIGLATGILIIVLNLIYFIGYGDSFFNKNTFTGILMIVVSLYMKDKNKK